MVENDVPMALVQANQRSTRQRTILDQIMVGQTTPLAGRTSDVRTTRRLEAGRRLMSYIMMSFCYTILLWRGYFMAHMLGFRGEL